MNVAVLGLGEAGSLFAADLARLGDDVHGYDPAPGSPIEGVLRHDSPEEAVAGSELVLAVTPGSRAATALSSVVDHLGDGVVYADLSAASPGTKRHLAAVAAASRVPFVDVALMSPVPGHGLAAPALAVGSGAGRYAELINSRGGRVEVLAGEAGDAVARKLLRSVVLKGLAALLIESTEAANRYGQAEWFWDHLAHQLGAIDETLMQRLLEATAYHADRRIDEMNAARDLLTELGVRPTMTEAVIEQLRRLAAEGMPETGLG
jgi:3-hydroxyisobutyrate dehydrogenase-like beta-hydroxyacid dehydrogenase